MTSASLIPSLQSDALTREIEQQLKDETTAVIAAAEGEAHGTLAQARAKARNQVHAAIEALRREGASRLVRAKAQLDTELHAQAQRRSARAVESAMPLLRDALNARWQDAEARKEWTTAVAQLAAKRLRSGSWQVTHPAGWSAMEQKDFVGAVGKADEIKFQADKKLSAGLRIIADQATLDATPDGLLADTRTIAALLLNDLAKGAPP